MIDPFIIMKTFGVSYYYINNDVISKTKRDAALLQLKMNCSDNKAAQIVRNYKINNPIHSYNS